MKLTIFSSQIKVFVEGLFAMNQDLAKFREHIRDFLIQIREFAGENTFDLFLDQKEEEIRQATLEKRKRQENVPGVLNPHEREDNMDG